MKHIGHWADFTAVKHPYWSALGYDIYDMQSSPPLSLSLSSLSSLSLSLFSLLSLLSSLSCLFLLSLHLTSWVTSLLSVVRLLFRSLSHSMYERPLMTWSHSYSIAYSHLKWTDPCWLWKNKKAHSGAITGQSGAMTYLLFCQLLNNRLALLLLLLLLLSHMYNVHTLSSLLSSLLSLSLSLSLSLCNLWHICSCTGPTTTRKARKKNTSSNNNSNNNSNNKKNIQHEERWSLSLSKSIWQVTKWLEKSLQFNAWVQLEITQSSEDLI